MTQRNKFDEIDRMFDEILQNNESVESLKERLSSSDDLLSLRNQTSYRSKVAVNLRRPTLPRSIPSALNSRLDIFLYCLKNVDFGTSNNRNYMEGHLQALNKFLEDAKLNAKNLEIVQASVSDEIKKWSTVSKTNLFDKGYYDGLIYTNQALKRSRDLMANKIEVILQRELFHE